MSLPKKLASLSPGLRKKIIVGERKYKPNPKTPITNWLVHSKRHCNGGKTVKAGLWLKQHTDKGGKIFLTMSGAGSSFQQGIEISELIRADKIAAISVTGANLEESLYRLVANSHYAYYSWLCGAGQRGGKRIWLGLDSAELRIRFCRKRNRSELFCRNWKNYGAKQKKPANIFYGMNIFFNYLSAKW